MDAQSYVITWRAAEQQRAIEAEHRRQAAERPAQQIRRHRRRRLVGVAKRRTH
ncbi:MAG: hypothetical protein FWF90_02075 [Promicromonosporaceae bacterium]|nr:hypothetical protein [Promicromonosporaceae bacterium]